MSLIETMQWRYATKKMNGTSVPQEKVDYILEAARLAPTSSGLQPFKVFVITNPELKAKIRPIAFDQSMVTDCSHLLVFAAWDNYSLERIDEMFAFTAEQRGVPASNFEDYKTRLWGMYSQKTAVENHHHASKQSYIAFTAAILAAAELKVDATPMEGFDMAALDALLELDKQGLKSTLLLPLGYRDAENDWLVNQKKVRNFNEKFITEIK
ncbi:MAG: nitroreductase family protein [Sphingobacteriaceae bacterium]|nr:nitroreductase family protein [Sphingobacteriaceae bacterium]